MEATDVVLLVAGLAVVVVMTSDVTATLVVTWGGAAAWRPSRAFYRLSWRIWSRLGRRIGDVDRQQRFLGFYAPVSVLLLLAIWVVGLLLGWSFVWLALSHQVHGLTDWGAAVYFSGVVLLTIGFGDIFATGLFPRLLTLAEAASGLATIALVISYLPVLYGAYGRREARMLTLDLASGDRITPVGLMLSQTPGGDLETLYQFFTDWQLWTAEVLESHTSYPMLAFFRSHHRGQSWITALGVVVDAAVISVALLPGAELRAPFYVYRRGRRAIEEIASRLDPPKAGPSELDREAFRYAYGLAEAAGLQLRPIDEAWAIMQELRGSYGDQLQSLFDYLVTPPGFWGHSAGDDLDEPELPEEFRAAISDASG
ncbi:MAG: potassium channel family protein [Actinobacteria bacterium]|nr:potassium channel family protein [Actinomycetota bacterium]MBW3651173.1 potassium channel family protein [Actinomycetota bacterium]